MGSGTEVQLTVPASDAYESVRDRKGYLATWPVKPCIPTHNLCRIFAIDDHPFLPQGIAAAVSLEPDLRGVAEALNGKRLLSLAISSLKTATDR